MIIKGNQFYKISEDFETTYAICNEKGLLEIANNDRTKEDGTGGVYIDCSALFKDWNK